ncbi:hypothetical protein [Methanobacterium alcaliphilum]|uniref:hypothetical protein n=1 Tax=Methanobacterium alcaliphilum TaxID=392018 RepID=UPI00200B0EC4|nr:hypothetical protein [Methanobacterium alcaliphilum]MCK9151290.1 hypothetical protein [Methanobacterium alcaliphilum]
MPRKYEVRNLILDALGENDLSRVDLMKTARKKSGLTISDKTLNEALIKLLRENVIGVVGYDIKIYNGVKRVQSMKSDGIIFSKFKNDQFETSLLIHKLESEDIEEVRNAAYRLKMLFKNKFSQLKLASEPNNDIDEVFNKIIRYINIQDEPQKRIMTQKLALALSDEKESNETLRQLLAFLRI